MYHSPVPVSVLGPRSDSDYSSVVRFPRFPLVAPAPSHAPAPGQPASPGRGDAEWQGVSGTRHKFFVYSAYCDDREKPLVRVIAATKTKKPDKVIQQF